MLLPNLKRKAIALAILASTAYPIFAQDAGVLTIYTARKEELIKPLLTEFTKQTGIVTEMISDDSAKLIARLEAEEGAATAADVLMPVDVSNMELAASKGLLMPITSEILTKNVPEQYRDKEGRWFGLGKRVRAIIYNKDKVKPEQLSTYEDLADPKWKGQILLRSSTHVYNQSLLAAIVAHGGEASAEAWVKGVMANLVHTPEGGDTDQIKAVAAGEANIAIANSYYLARLINSDLPEEKEIAAKLAIFFPNQTASEGQLQGAHVNLSGAAVLAKSDNAQAAQQLIEFLSSPDAQRIYADSNQEYPVNPEVEPSETLKTFGAYKADDLPLNAIAEQSVLALKIADRSGWK